MKTQLDAIKQELIKGGKYDWREVLKVASILVGVGLLVLLEAWLWGWF